MNQRERDAIREAHNKVESPTAKNSDWCYLCDDVWPCDAIKVLNAWEVRELEWAYDYLIKSGVHK
jgi:hypothetical protein